ncbi:MAG: hybrid sensor histidine kinase/response regulator [Candidatus Pacebacteria bacterium]|nr:hybrid sensor histidine kinase/response regulator [Candidatus Paceibacterota bacterium]
MANWKVSFWTTIFSYSAAIFWEVRRLRESYADEPMRIFGDVAVYFFSLAIHMFAFLYLLRAYERKERMNFVAESELGKEKQFWKQTLGSLPDCVIICCGGCIKYCNLNAFEVFGVPFKDCSGDLDFDRVLSQLREVVSNDGLESLASIVQGHQLVRSQAGNHNFVYGRISLHVKTVEIVHEGRVYLEYIIQDVTAIEELQKSQAMNRCVNLLIATASHEIRTPLNAIEGAIEIISKLTTNSEITDNLNLARVSSQRLLLYLQALSFLEHVEANTLHFSYTKLDVVHSIRGLIQLLEYTARGKGVEIVFAPKFPLLCFCTDKEKFELVLYNIIENAVKYTFAGTVNISVSYTDVTRQLRVVVCDTGTGIPEPKKHSLFKLFPSIVKGTQLCPQGIGMGLYLCQQLAISMGGGVTIDSREGEGTMATVTFRGEEDGEPTGVPMSAVEPTEESKIPSERHSPQLAPSPGSMRLGCQCSRVLIVDDEPVNIMIIQSYLAGCGISHADVANNGKVAVERVAEHMECQECGGYGLVFMDINMPVMDGIEATQRITNMARKREGAITIIAITAAAQLESEGVYEKYQHIGFAEIRILSPELIGIDSAEAGLEADVHQHRDEISRGFGGAQYGANITYCMYNNIYYPYYFLSYNYTKA